MIILGFELSPFATAPGVSSHAGKRLSDSPQPACNTSRLAAILPEPGLVLYASHFDGEGGICSRKSAGGDVEGIVAKWKHGTYLDGATLRTSWANALGRERPRVSGVQRVMTRVIQLGAKLVF